MAKSEKTIWVEATEHPVLREGRERNIDPETKRDRNAIHVEDGAVEVPLSSFTRRRIASGDLRQVDAPDGTRYFDTTDEGEQAENVRMSAASAPTQPSKKPGLVDRVFHRNTDEKGEK